MRAHDVCTSDSDLNLLVCYATLSLWVTMSCFSEKREGRGLTFGSRPDPSRLPRGRRSVRCRLVRGVRTGELFLLGYGERLSGNAEGSSTVVAAAIQLDGIGDGA